MKAMRLLANTLWVLSCLPAAIKFKFALANVAKTQARLLKKIVRQNADTRYGRKYRFAEIRGVTEFMKQVPIVQYDDLEDYIEEIVAGETNILTGSEIILLETTSGSSAPSKLIPYTRDLKRQFNYGVGPWIADIYRKYPAILAGSSYWSISPVKQLTRRTKAGIPIGFEEDQEYFGVFGQLLLNRIFAVPSAVKYIDNIEAFRYVTMLFLLKAQHLALISVWNPTFLTLLLDTLDSNYEDLLADLGAGRISPRVSVSQELRAKLESLLRSNKKRAAELRALKDEPDRYAKIWPGLKLISCWKDAAAYSFAEELQKRFPGVSVQGKGLLATEGLISFPFRDSYLLSVRSHFFEFETLGASGEFTGKTVQAHETRAGEKYGVIITTGGGLYRYRLLDIVEVTGHVKKCPVLKFLGKYQSVSDLFGEKLNDIHVQNVLAASFKQHQVSPKFCLVAPLVRPEGGAAYVLYLQTAEAVGSENLKALASAVEVGLGENFHYKYCRDLGQLDAVKLFVISDSALETYNEVYRENGIREGDIKTKILHKDLNWQLRFKGEFLT